MILEGTSVEMRPCVWRAFRTKAKELGCSFGEMISLCIEKTLRAAEQEVQRTGTDANFFFLKGLTMDCREFGPVRVQKVQRVEGKDGRPGYAKVQLVWMGGMHGAFVELSNVENFEKCVGREVMLSGRLEAKGYDLKLSDLKVVKALEQRAAG